MAKPVSTVVAEFEVRIDAILSSAVFGRPTLNELNSDISCLYQDPQFKRLPNYAQGQLVCYTAARRKSMLDKYTLLLTIGQDGRKTLGKWDKLTEEEREFIRGGGKLKSAFYWLSEQTTCTDDGVITSTFTPTDKIYFQSEDS